MNHTTWILDPPTSLFHSSIKIHFLRPASQSIMSDVTSVHYNLVSRGFLSTQEKTGKNLSCLLTPRHALTSTCDVGLCKQDCTFSPLKDAKLVWTAVNYKIYNPSFNTYFNTYFLKETCHIFFYWHHLNLQMLAWKLFCPQHFSSPTKCCICHKTVLFNFLVLLLRPLGCYLTSGVQIDWRQGGNYYQLCCQAH